MSVPQLVPPLEPFCNSWVIIDRETGVAVFETYNIYVAEHINQKRYEVKTAYQHLVDVNKQIEEGAY